MKSHMYDFIVWGDTNPQKVDATKCEEKDSEQLLKDLRFPFVVIKHFLDKDSGDICITGKQSKSN